MIDPVVKDALKHAAELDKAYDKAERFDERVQEIRQLILDGNYHYKGQRYIATDIMLSVYDNEHYALTLDVSVASLIESGDMFSEKFRCAAFMVMATAEKALNELAKKMATKEFENE